MIGQFPMSCDHDTRCPSRIAYEAGVVLRCQRPVHLGDNHRTLHVSWRDDDDRLLAGTPEVDR